MNAPLIPDNDPRWASSHFACFFCRTLSCSVKYNSWNYIYVQKLYILFSSFKTLGKLFLNIRAWFFDFAFLSFAGWGGASKSREQKATTSDGEIIYKAANISLYFYHKHFIKLCEFHIHSETLNCSACAHQGNDGFVVTKLLFGILQFSGTWTSCQFAKRMDNERQTMTNLYPAKKCILVVWIPS